MTEQTQYRCYHFGNFYLSQIQQGIQAAHAQTEMWIKYNNFDDVDCPQENILMNWAVNHKTMICLNGGMASDLQDLVSFLQDSRNPYPWAFFCEEEAALNNALTNVCVVLPNTVYDLVALIRDRRTKVKYDGEFGEATLITADGDIVEVTGYDYEIAMRLSKCGLA